MFLTKLSAKTIDTLVSNFGLKKQSSYCDFYTYKNECAGAITVVYVHRKYIIKRF